MNEENYSTNQISWIKKEWPKAIEGFFYHNRAITEPLVQQISETTASIDDDKIRNSLIIERFVPIQCPIVSVLVDAKESVRENYDQLQFVILRLYSSGFKSADAISKMTGLDVHSVESYLQIEEDIYGHIHNGKLTETGLDSIEHSCNVRTYNIKRDVKVEGITAAILDSEHERRNCNFKSISSQMPFIEPVAEVDKKVNTEIKINIETYVSNELHPLWHAVLGINDVEAISTRASTYAFMVKLKHLPDPFILLYAYKSNLANLPNYYKPTGLSARNYSALGSPDSIKPWCQIRDNNYYNYLNSLINDYKFIIEPKTGTINEFLQEVHDALL